MRGFRFVIAAGFLAVIGAPTGAAPPGSFNAIASAGDNESIGMALARRQIARGETVDALATLERVIILHPQSMAARLLHAGVLCLADDRQGSLIEFERLRGYSFSKAQWAEATAPCRARTGG